MNKFLCEDTINVKNINLWAHVGVLEKERLLGQKFLVDLTLWINMRHAAQNDDLASTADYSLAIGRLQKLSSEINCLTIEHFSEKILDALEELYGAVPMHVVLSKCSPPIPGFDGNVSVGRSRYLHLIMNNV